MLRFAGITAVLCAALVGSGCVITPKSNGELIFGIDENALFGRKVGTVQTPQGSATLRRNASDGKYSLRFNHRFKVMDLGRYDDVRIETFIETPENTGLLLRTVSSSGCARYELLNISRSSVTRTRLQSSCREIGWDNQGDQIVMREAVPERARLWLWRDGEVTTGREERAPRAPRATRTSQRADQSGAAGAPEPWVPPPLPESTAPVSRGGRVTLPTGELPNARPETVEHVILTDEGPPR